MRQGGGRGVFVALPKAITSQKRNGPPITILRVDRPFEAETGNELDPDEGEDGDWGPAYLWGGRRVLNPSGKERFIHAWWELILAICRPVAGEQVAAFRDNIWSLRKKYSFGTGGMAKRGHITVYDYLTGRCYSAISFVRLCTVSK